MRQVSCPLIFSNVRLSTVGKTQWAAEMWLQTRRRGPSVLEAAKVKGNPGQKQGGKLEFLQVAGKVLSLTGG